MCSGLCPGHSSWRSSADAPATGLGGTRKSSTQSTRKLCTTAPTQRSATGLIHDEIVIPGQDNKMHCNNRRKAQAQGRDSADAAIYHQSTHACTMCLAAFHLDPNPLWLLHCGSVVSTFGMRCLEPGLLSPHLLLLPPPPHAPTVYGKSQVPTARAKNFQDGTSSCRQCFL